MFYILKSSKAYRGYSDAGNRNRAIAQLRRRGFNYFVCYRDVQSPFALNFGVATWVAPGGVYINR